MAESLISIPAEIVHDSICQSYPNADGITLEDCRLTDEDRVKVFDTTHPAAAYRGFPHLQREILAFEHAEERRQKEEEKAAAAAGHIALAK
jgi:hypothetical protein